LCRKGLILDSPKAKIIAVIDDDPGCRSALVNLLNAFGYDTEPFDSAASFLDAAVKSRASCLVVDIQLGDISGIELARQLAAEGFDYPVIFVTALNDAHVRTQAVAAGCVAFLTKPFSAKQMIDAIGQAAG
jgi:FixJ family two-component response regulator